MGGEVEFKAYAPGQGEPLPSYTADALEPSDAAFFVDGRGFESLPVLATASGPDSGT